MNIFMRQLHSYRPIGARLRKTRVPAGVNVNTGASCGEPMRVMVTLAAPLRESYHAHVGACERGCLEPSRHLLRRFAEYGAAGGPRWPIAQTDNDSRRFREWASRTALITTHS